jgi:hypothetical protein
MYDAGRFLCVTGMNVSVVSEEEARAAGDSLTFIATVHPYDFSTVARVFSGRREASQHAGERSERVVSAQPIAGRLDLRNWLNEHGIRILSEKWEGGKATYEIECQGTHGGYAKDDGRAFAIQFPDGPISYGCQHASCSHYHETGNHWLELRAMYEGPRHQWRPFADTSWANPEADDNKDDDS